jgi:elongation factor P
MRATQIRKGNILIVKGALYRVMNMDHITPGKGPAHIQTKLRKLIDGNQTEVRFRSDENVERAVLEQREMQYLYADGDGHHFMDMESYEQLAMSEGTLGDALQYIVPDTVIIVETHDGNPLGVQLPPGVILEVVECPPAVKDATASAQRKPAKCNTGLTVQVPAFINEGEKIRVSTQDGSYMERAK